MFVSSYSFLCKNKQKFILLCASVQRWSHLGSENLFEALNVDAQLTSSDRGAKSEREGAGLMAQTLLPVFKNTARQILASLPGSKERTADEKSDKQCDDL